jgi:diaminopimelate epimerase
MMYYNAAGRMCGNGGRCIAMFAVLKNIVGKEQTFEALDHIYAASVENGYVILAMKDPHSKTKRLSLYLGRKKILSRFIDTGSPHIVIDISKPFKGDHLQSLDVQ